MSAAESPFADVYEPLSSLDHSKDERDAHRIAWLERRADDARRWMNHSAFQDERAKRAEGERDYLREALARATTLAIGLLPMIDRETWRATGGDDGQGHYEGDYHTERIATELREIAALARSTPEQEQR